MQNKCNCGCNGQQGFVPVNSNWDFNMNGDCACQQNRSNRRRSQNCDSCDNEYTREWGNDRRSGSDCQCERCDDSREAACCEQNTYVRDMDECECASSQNRSRNNGCKEGCTCENCTRARARSNEDGKKCGCNDEYAYTRNRCSCEDEYAYNRTRCGCQKDNDSGYSRKNRGVGMMKGYMQEIDEIFESESALRSGTLFPELHKPLNGYCPCDSNCGTCAQAAAFAAWEMRLYLNTHPNDQEALALFRKLCKEAEDENYATTFLTDDCCTNGWNWVKNPWPWEYSCQCGD